jgi:hypothetical protein
MRKHMTFFAVLALVSASMWACGKAGDSKGESKDQAADSMDDQNPGMGMGRGRGMGRGMGRDMGPMEPGDDGDMGGMGPERAAGSSPKTMTSKDGAVTVALPAGDGWDCVDQQAKGPGGHEASLVKCRRADRQEFFFLVAKVYGVSKEEVKPAKELATEVFMTTYKKLFSAHKIVKEGPAKMGDLEGYEVALEMTHSRMGELKKTERVFVKGEQVFILSGEGKADVVARFEKHLADWFSGASFKALQP